jgi:hypothetical protein
MILSLVACGAQQFQSIQLTSMEEGSQTSDPGLPDDPSEPPPPPAPDPTPNPGPTPTPDLLPQGWTPAWNNTRFPERNEWTEHTYKQTQNISVTGLMSDLKDAKDFCPAWSNLDLNDRRGFLTVLLSAMAKYESNFDPNSKFEEGFNDNSGKPVISRGLLQLSVESSNSYDCKVTASSLHDPTTNLTCGLRIISRWMVRDKYVGSTVSGSHMGGARYWSVLRGSSGSRPKIREYMRAQAKCQ